LLSRRVREPEGKKIKGNNSEYSGDELCLCEPMIKLEGLGGPFIRGEVREEWDRTHQTRGRITVPTQYQEGKTNSSV